MIIGLSGRKRVNLKKPQGNNKFGRTGKLRCVTCRGRKGKVYINFCATNFGSAFTIWSQSHVSFAGNMIWPAVVLKEGGQKQRPKLSHPLDPRPVGIQYDLLLMLLLMIRSCFLRYPHRTMLSLTQPISRCFNRSMKEAPLMSLLM